MKVNISLDMTPQEARAVMGLPDVEALQEEMLKQIQARMSESIQDMGNPEKLLEMYMPLGNQGMEQLQKMMTMFSSKPESS
ncbi:MAG: DUF6489 family protein [Lysobacterales bacterium]